MFITYLATCQDKVSVETAETYNNPEDWCFDGEQDCSDSVWIVPGTITE